jgi:hypothetical protein
MGQHRTFIVTRVACAAREGVAVGLIVISMIIENKKTLANVLKGLLEG